MTCWIPKYFGGIPHSFQHTAFQAGNALEIMKELWICPGQLQDYVRSIIDLDSLGGFSELLY